MANAYTYIRFSTLEQQHGDSLRRQNEAIEDFVASNKLRLTESQAFQDLGVSGYRGANLKSGLGKFIAEVEAGQVPKGSYLIVESLDRLSRQRVMDALTLLVTLIDKGIKVVTLNDAGPQVLDKDAGLPALVIALSTMQRANSESDMKSKRVKAAWANKRKNAANLPVSSRGPEWLKFNKLEKKFEPLNERVSVILKIYELADAGLGRGRIVKHLNTNGYLSFRSPSQGWQTSSVTKLLKNRALIGFYQPFQLAYDEETGKKSREPAGEEIPNYYPSVIDLDLFRRVSTKKYAPTVPLKGRQGESLTNLFTGMTFCKWCEAPMTLTNKGPGSKGGTYLVCSKARRGKDCIYRSWKYEDAEIYILTALRGLDIGSILAGIDLDGRLKEVRNLIAKTAEQLDLDEKKISRYEEELTKSDESPSRTVIKILKALEESVDNGRRRLVLLQSEEIGLDSPMEDAKTFGDKLVKLYDEMETASPQERYLIRVRLRNRISQIVHRIELLPVKRNDPEFIRGAPKTKKYSWSSEMERGS
ncbi:MULTISPECIES: recombinase family protein [Xanthomonas]|uniref:recombinase family protein n=1 Tax=Xanthomonas TaxID=338 RepID=UPI001374B526|nr:MULTISPECIES: recombinase family protein [Xanthomonas]